MGKYTGKHRGIVVATGDSEKRGQLRARIPGLGQNFVTDWALPAHSSFTRDTPAIGMGVWMEFEWPADGPDNPIWTGIYSSLPGGFSEHPRLAQQPAPGAAPFNRGLRPATTANLTDLGGRDPVTWYEPPTAVSAVYPTNHVRETPGGITEEWDDTPGARRVHRRFGAFYDETNEAGTVARGGASLFEWWTSGVRRFVGGTLAQVIAGDAHTTVEGEAQVSVLGALVAKLGSLRAKIGGLVLTADSTGAEASSSGGLSLLALGDAILRGRRALLTSIDKTTVSSAGDVTIEALGALDSMLYRVVLAAFGLSPGSGKITARGNSLELSTLPTFTGVPPSTTITIDDNGLTAKGLLPDLLTIPPIIADDIGWAAIKALQVDPISGLILGGQGLVLALAAGNIRRSSKIRSE